MTEKAAESTETTVKVLVVDDEPFIVEMITMGLTYEGFTVQAAYSGNDALDLAHAMKPHLVILDILLPDLDGLEICRRLRATGDLGIIMLTARDQIEDRIIGLEMGADDYLGKPFSFRELLARIHAVLRRQNIALQRILRARDLTLDRQTRAVTRAEQRIDLTVREFAILELLLAHPRQVLTREVMLNRIWGYDYSGDSNVIDVHIYSLREKIGDAQRQIIRNIRGIGYVLDPAEATG